MIKNLGNGKWKFVGEDKDFHAIWTTNTQNYEIYKKDKYLLTVDRLEIASNYLN